MVELIYTEERRGTGKENDPIRLCPQLWSKDGLFVAEHDPCPKGDCDNPTDEFSARNIE